MGAGELYASNQQMIGEQMAIMKESNRANTIMAYIQAALETGKRIRA